ncbi:MAG: hypothetical protein JEZ09_18370 [Salinivirgaceae bacterium]|nr:hypothetical protein [Salinivirgaceae bacterium]
MKTKLILLLIVFQAIFAVDLYSQAKVNSSNSNEYNSIAFFGRENSFNKGTTILQSPNAKFRLIFGDDGNLFIANMNSHGNKIWQTNTANKDAQKFVIQSDGNMVICNTSNKEIWVSNSGKLDVNQICLYNDGSFTALSLGGKVAWSAKEGLQIDNKAWNTNNDQFWYGNVILLMSPNKKHTFVFKEGNLILYQEVKYKWSTDLNNNLAKKVKFDKAGNLFLFDDLSDENTEHIVWSSNSAGKEGEALVLENDCK